MTADIPHISLSRRHFMSCSAALGASLAVGGTALANTMTPSLGADAARSGRFFGAAVKLDQIGRGGDLRELVLRNCGHLTPEIGLQWNALEPSPGELSFGRMDQLTQFAAANGKKVIGHSLLWHLGSPAWVNQHLADHKDWTPIKRHFASVLPWFGESIEFWNVVNEPIDIGLRPDGLRRNVFLEAFGPDYISRALEAARELAPRTPLIINEYGLEYDFPVERARRAAFLKLIEGLKAKGAPLDGVGLQAHLDLEKGQISQREGAAFIKEISDMGLAITVTELDMKESAYTASAQARDQMVADGVRRYLDVVLDQPAVTGVVTWGLSDRHSWLEVTEADYARFPGAWAKGDGPGLNRGLPYDSDLRPKPLYEAISAALRGARPARRA